MKAPFDIIQTFFVSIKNGFKKNTRKNVYNQDLCCQWKTDLESYAGALKVFYFKCVSNVPVFEVVLSASLISPLILHGFVCFPTRFGVSGSEEVGNDGARPRES